MNNRPDNTRATPQPSPTRRGGAQKRKAEEAGILGTQWHSKSDDNTKRQKTSTTSTATPLQPSNVQPTTALQPSSTQQNRAAKSLAHSTSQRPISNALKNKSRAPSTKTPHTQSSVAMSQRKSRTTDITVPPAGLVPTNYFLPTAAAIEPPKQVAKKRDPDRPRFTASSKPSPAILRMRKKREQAAATIPSSYYAIHAPHTPHIAALGRNRGASNSRSFPVAMSAKTTNSLSEVSAHTKTTTPINEAEKPQRHPQPAKRKTRERVIADNLEEGPSKRRKTSSHTAKTPLSDNEHAHPAPVSMSGLRPNHKSRSQSKRKLDTIENEDAGGSTKRPRIASSSPISIVHPSEDTSMDVPAASTPTEEPNAIPATTTEFHKFRDLPPELRTLIWEFAVAVPRNVLPYINWKEADKRGWKDFYMRSANPVPALFHTCYESRDIATKKYESISPTWKRRRIYFNYDIDTLYINHVNSLLTLSMIDQRKKFRNVAIHVPENYWSEDIGETLMFLRCFESLRNLTLVRENFHRGLVKEYGADRFSGRMTFGESEDYTLLPPLYNPTSLPDNLQAQRELTALKGKYQLIDGRKWSETTFEKILEHLSPFKDSVFALDLALPARKDVNITAKVFGSKRIRESLLQAARDDKSGVFAGIVDEDDNDLFGNSVSN